MCKQSTRDIVCRIGKEKGMPTDIPFSYNIWFKTLITLNLDQRQEPYLHPHSIRYQYE